MSESLLEISSWLKTKWVILPAVNGWLRSCVEYYMSENPGCRAVELREFVYEQWLLADVREVASGCLPANCSTVDKVSLNGRYALQVNYAVDISRSFYKQLTDIRRPEVAENLEVDSEGPPEKRNVSTKRSLKIELTDGVVTILGFEEQPIPKLVEPIAPGIKVLIVGPIDCRKGVLLLKPHNIQILGGEVDTLLISNATENVLARALGVEENPDPYKTLAAKAIFEDEDEDDEALAMLASQIETTVSQGNSGIITAPSSTFDLESDDDEFVMIAAMTASIAESSQRPTVQRAGTSNLPQREHGIVTPTVDSIPRSKTTANSLPQKTVPVKNQRQTTLHGFFSQTENEPENLRESLQEYYGSNNTSKSRMSVKQQNGDKTNASPSLEEYRPSLNCKSNDRLPAPILRPDQMVVDYLTSEEEEAIVASMLEAEMAVSQPSIPPPKVAPSVQPPPAFVPTLFPPKTFPSVVTVMASVLRLPQKLCMRNDKWCLSAIISARDIELEVDFSPETLNKIFGITAAEVKARKNEVLKNPEVKEKINEILKTSQMRIKNLKCKMVIEFSSFIAKPVISDVFDT